MAARVLPRCSSWGRRLKRFVVVKLHKKIIRENRVIRGIVNGKSCYCRIPVRRRRTPIYAEELEEILWENMGENGVDTGMIEAKVMGLIENSDFEQAGRLLSALDFVSLFEQIAFED